MNEFFEEYGWLLQSLIGGSLGVEILFAYIVDKSGMFSELLRAIMKGLM